MNYTKTKFPGLLILEPIVFGDERGYFFETFKKEELEIEIGKINFVQENESKSGFGVLRGLHFQKPPFAQAKLVRCISGTILDVVVDLRIDSPTFHQHFAIELSGNNKLQLFIPRGFAHGFAVLSDDAIFSYKVDNPYAPDFDCGIRYDDPELLINWKLKESETILSGKDRTLPPLNKIEEPFFL